MSTREDAWLRWFAEKLPYHYPRRLRRGRFYDVLLTWNPLLLLPDMRVVEQYLPKSPAEENLLKLWIAWQKIMMGNESEGFKELCELARILYDRCEPFIFLGMYGLKIHNRGLAWRAFSRALKNSPDFHLVQDLLRRFGVRRTPLLPFLPRHHWLNMTLGKLRSRLFKPRSGSP